MNRNIKESVDGWLIVVHWGIIAVRQCLGIRVIVRQYVVNMRYGCVVMDECKWHRWWCCWGLGQGRVCVHGCWQWECATGRQCARGYTRFHLGIWICGTSHWPTGRRADWRLRAGVAQWNSIWSGRLMPASVNGVIESWVRSLST